MKTCVVTNRKGGVGKTTLALHLAAAGVASGLRTLLVDLDPQASATSVACPDPAPAAMVESLWDDAAQIQPSATAWGFDMLAASAALAGADDLSLDDTDAALQRLPGGYELLVFDTPPYCGVLQTAPLLRANLLIAPVEPDIFALRGLKDLQNTVTRIRPRNPGLQMRVVANRLKRRALGQMQTVEAMQDALAWRFVKPALAEREGVRRARDAGKPVWDYTTEAYARDWQIVCNTLISE